MPTKKTPGKIGCRECSHYGKTGSGICLAGCGWFLPQDECPKYDYKPIIKITDKLITDKLMEQHEFFCDGLNPNYPLYIWEDGVWNNGVSEGVILKDVTNILKEEEARTLMRLQRTTDFIKGESMRTMTEKPPTLISFKNGLLNVETMELGEHDSQYFIVNQIPHEYDPKAECPAWLEWLNEVIRPEDIDFIQEWMGYTLYNTVPEAAFVILTGSGQNGKTVFMDFFTSIIGEINSSAETFQSLTYGPYAMASVYHMLANISDEIGSYVIKNSSRIKELSAGSRVRAREIYGKKFFFYPYAKATFACNTPPEIKDMSDAIKMRLKAVEFPYTFSKHPVGDQKPAQEKKVILKALENETPGVINWILIGLKRLMDNGFAFTTSRSTEETWQFYRRKSLPVLSFMEEILTVTDDDDDVIGSEEMYTIFSSWLDEKGINVSISRQKMIQDLRAEGIIVRQLRGNDRKRMYYGVTLEQGKNGKAVCLSKDSNVVSNRENARDSVTLDQYDEHDSTDDEGYPSPG